MPPGFTPAAGTPAPIPDLAFVSVDPNSRLLDRCVKFPRSQHRPSLNTQQGLLCQCQAWCYDS